MIDLNVYDNKDLVDLTNNVVTFDKSELQTVIITADANAKNDYTKILTDAITATDPKEIETQTNAIKNSNSDKLIVYRKPTNRQNVSIDVSPSIDINPTTVWDNDDSSEYPSGVIRSNVEQQDKFLIDDAETPYELLGAVKNSAIQLAQNTAAGGFIKKFLTDDEEARPEGTNTYDSFEKLKKIKSEKYKNIKMKSKLGLYNSLLNLVGCSAGLFCGALGKNPVANVLDDMSAKFTGGIGIAGIVSRLDAAAEATPTLKEIISLNLANFYTMYTAKPGRIVRNRYNKFNYFKTDVNGEDLNLSDYNADGTTEEATVDDWKSELKQGKFIKSKISGLAKKLPDNGALGWAKKKLGVSAEEQKNEEEVLTTSETPFVRKRNTGDFDIKAKGVQNISDVQIKDYFENAKINNPSNGEETFKKQKISRDKRNDWTSDNYTKSDEFTINADDVEFETLKNNTTVTLQQLFEKVSSQSFESSIDIVRAEKKGVIGYSKTNLSEVISQINKEEWYSTLSTRLNKSNALGGLYIEPFYNGSKINCDFIPFEFNPVINEGGVEAKYAQQEVMGRLLSVRSYVGTDSQTLTIETKYFATAPIKSEENKESEKNKENKENKENKGNKGPFPTPTWMDDWTPEKLANIERKYLKLVYPYISENVFVRPPIVRIKLFETDNNGNNGTSELTVGDLYSYPIIDGKKYLEVTNTLDGFTKQKRYIVTNVVINPLNNEDWGNSFNIGTIVGSDSDKKIQTYRRGFTVSLTLAETTKNFLDTIPSYEAYNTAIKGSDFKANSQEKRAIDSRALAAEVAGLWKESGSFPSYKADDKGDNMLNELNGLIVSENTNFAEVI